MITKTYLFGDKENYMVTDEEYLKAKKVVLKWESQYNRPVEIVSDAELDKMEDEILTRFKKALGYSREPLQDINYYRESLEECKKRIDW